MSVMRYLTVPDDQSLLAALGRMTVVHAQLDYVLKLTIMVVEGRTHDEVMRDKDLRGSRKMRKRILKHADKRLGGGEATKKLKALLEKAEKASDRRNAYLHNVFGSDDQGRHWTHTENGESFDIPSVAQLNELTEKIQLIMKELNTARRKGWLIEAVDKTSRKKSKVKKSKNKKLKSEVGKKGQSSPEKSGLPVTVEDRKRSDRKGRKVKANSKDEKVDEGVTAAAATSESAPAMIDSGGGEPPLIEAVLKQVLVEDNNRKSDDKDT
jgi:hypothetical protein